MQPFTVNAKNEIDLNSATSKRSFIWARHVVQLPGREPYEHRSSTSAAQPSPAQPDGGHSPSPAKRTLPPTADGGGGGPDPNDTASAVMLSVEPRCRHA